MSSMDLIFRFLGEDAGAGREFDRMASKADHTKAALASFAVGTAIAAGVVAVASVDMAAKFQTAMTRLQTQANVSAKNVGILSKGILSMAGAVAESPNELADAAYHIASVGQHAFTTAQELNILKIASEGAKLGNADLVDVTNALDAVLISHIKGVKNYTQAMGELNATVGAGDMTMQDLADALGHGNTAAFATAGASIDEVSAALATFGDNNLRGVSAGTALRMMIQGLLKPSSTGAAALAKLNLSFLGLRTTLADKGLTATLGELHSHLEKFGGSSNTWDGQLIDAFTKRSGTGLAILMKEWDRYNNKLHEVDAGGKNFASSWATYTKTFGYAWDSAVNSAHALLIELGTKLLPVATKFMQWISQDAIPALGRFGDWLKSPSGVIEQHLVPALRELWSFISSKLIPVLSGVLKDAIQGAENAFHRIGQTIRNNKPAIDSILGSFKSLASFVVNKVVPVLGPLLGGTFELIGMYVSANIRLYSRLIDAGRDVVHFFTGSFVHGIGQMVSLFAKGMKDMADVALDAFGVIVHGGASALGWVPGIGGKLKGAATAFDNFKASVDATLSGLAADAGGWGVTAGGNFSSGWLAGIQGEARSAAQGKGWFAGIQGEAHTALTAAAKKASKSAGSQFLDDLGSGLGSGGTGGDGSLGSAVDKAFKGTPLKTAHIGHLLAQGLLNGWTGESDRIKNVLGTQVENALNHMTSLVDKATDRLKAKLKTLRSQLKSDLKSRAGDIKSLAGTIGGAGDLSNLFGTDANGSPTMGNVNTFLSSQVGPLARFAQDLKWARAHGMNKTLLSQIANLGPGQGELILKQFTSGAASISQANASENLIQKYSTSAATTTEDALYKSVLAKDRQKIQQQTDLLRKIEHHLSEIQKKAGREVAEHVTIETNGKGLKLTREDAREIVRALRELDKNVGITVKPKHGK